MQHRIRILLSFPYLKVVYLPDILPPYEFLINWPMKIAEDCTACGWTSTKQMQCCYFSHVKLIYSAHNRDVWSIGSDLILERTPRRRPED